MNVLAEPFWVPKHGNLEEEYEDAVWPRERQEYEESCIRFAVADGATESSYAGRWAAQLVQAVGEDRLAPARLADGLAPMRAAWRQWMTGLTLPWHAEEKVAQGAFAALVVLELSAAEPDEGSEGRWQAAAVGDSCLFQVHGEDVTARFPLDSATAFDSRPYLLGSLGSDAEDLAERVFRQGGTWAQGDIFYLMTDALAWCFFREAEPSGRAPGILRDFARIEGRPAFALWVQSLRDVGSIRNDDCTLLRISIR